jgi:CRISPR system Cascade subunit CasE
MSLYLSRISLNPLHAPAIKLAADPEALHKKLYALLATGTGAEERHCLFRVEATEAGPNVLLQTVAEPEWDALELAARSLRQPPETKAYDPTFVQGQRLSFRLLAKPSIRKAGEFGLKANGKRKPGPRITCRDDEERLEWLRWKGNDSGFTVESVGLTILSVPAVKSDVGPRAKGGSFTAVQFDGVLVVTDPDKLREAVRNGIGPQKAYGFGLLSLAPLASID